MTMEPPRNNAYIATSKLTGYLLNRNGTIDAKGKAKFLYGYGFTVNNWQQLEDALFVHLEHSALIETELTDYGIKYRFYGNLPTPDNRNPLILTIWQLDNGTDRLRFVTLVPKYMRME